MRDNYMLFEFWEIGSGTDVSQVEAISNFIHIFCIWKFNRLMKQSEFYDLTSPLKTVQENNNNKQARDISTQTPYDEPQT